MTAFHLFDPKRQELTLESGRVIGLPHAVALCAQAPEVITNWAKQYGYIGSSESVLVLE